MKEALEIEAKAIKYLIEFMDTEVLDLMHENIYEYIQMFPSGSLKAPKILEILEEEMQMRHEAYNDL